MPLPSIKVIWGSSRQLPGQWRLGLFGRPERHSGGGRVLAVSLRGVLRWGLALTMAGYFSGAGAYYLWLDRKPYNFVTYADLVLPTHWSRLSGLRGQAMIAEGMDDWHHQNPAGALQLLGPGLSRYPQSWKARLVVAQFYLEMNNRRQAVTLLREGLRLGYPGREYLSDLSRLAALGEDFDLWLETCDTALAQLADKPALAEDRKWVVQQKLSALIAADRGADAVRLAESEGEQEGPVMKEFKVLALLKAGQPVEAVDFLASWRATDGGTVQLLRLQVRACREAGRLDDMDRALAELRQLDPAAPPPYIYAVIQQLLAARRPEARRAFDDFVLRFSSKLSNLVMLADPLAEIGEEPLLLEVMALARSQGLELLPIQRSLVIVRMHGGDWAGAGSVLAEMKSAIKPSDATGQFWYRWMSLIVAAATDPADGTQSRLVSFVRERRLTLSLYRETLVALQRAARPATAREIVTFARGVYPDNQSLLDTQEVLDRQLAAAAPTPAAVKPTATAASDIVFFAALSRLVKAGDLAGALQQIHDLRASRPAWLDAHEDELQQQEILLDGRLGNVLELQAAVRYYLTGDQKRSSQAVELARQLRTADRKVESVLLLKEILRKVPGFPPAQRQLDLWEPPPPPPIKPGAKPAPPPAVASPGA